MVLKFFSSRTRKPISFMPGYRIALPDVIPGGHIGIGREPNSGEKEIGMKVVLRCFIFLWVALAFAGFLQAANQETPPGGVEAIAPAPVSGPSVEIPETSFNFGTLTDGKDYVHDFKIKNTGTAPLEIKKVLPG